MRVKFFAISSFCTWRGITNADMREEGKNTCVTSLCAFVSICMIFVEILWAAINVMNESVCVVPKAELFHSLVYDLHNIVQRQVEEIMLIPFYLSLTPFFRCSCINSSSPASFFYHPLLLNDVSKSRSYNTNEKRCKVVYVYREITRKEIYVNFHLCCILFLTAVEENVHVVDSARDELKKRELRKFFYGLRCKVKGLAYIYPWFNKA